jgi:hypothetical protein
MSEFDGPGNFSNLKKAQIRSLWDRGVKGWKFDPPFKLAGHENQLKLALGGHNASA